MSKGRGYVSADRNKGSSTIGVIPVDSIFSPVRRVAFQIEPTRVEQSTAYDRLVLDIETDGSINPREALASAGDTLRSLVGLVADMSDDPQGLELARWPPPPPARPTSISPSRTSTCSERPRNCLERAQVNSDRRAPPEDRGRPPGHHRLRPEVARRGDPEVDERGLRCARRTRDQKVYVSCRPPQKGRRFGGRWQHQRRLMADLVAFVAAQGIVTTEAKAEALRPVAEKVITKAKKGGLHNHRQVVSYLGDKDGPLLSPRSGLRYADRTAATPAS